MDPHRTLREIVSTNKQWKVRVSAASGGTYEVQVLHWTDADGRLFWQETGAALRVGDLSNAERLALRVARRWG